MTAPAAQRYDALIAGGLTPIARWGEPADVGATVATLALGRLPFSTGQAVHVDGGMLRFEARTAVGDLYDAFELHKQEGDINRLVEIEPEVPENKRGE